MKALIKKKSCSLQQRELFVMAEIKTDFCESLKSEEIKESDSDETDSLMRQRSVSFINKYKMNHSKRGKAIIFNHFRFTSSTYGERKGTESDVKNLTIALLQLGFQPEDIIIHDDLTASEISEELKKVQNEDHSERDLLMVFVLTHGSNNDRVSASDVEYPVESLWEPFRADKCRTLAGKPKIFFVNACRGQFIDQGQRVPIKDDDSVTEVDARPVVFYNSYSIPVWSDFLYVFSTYKGYVSYRNTGEGSWYIQAFCKELSQTNITELSFTDFLTAVNGRLSRLFESGPVWDQRKQIPTFSSTLTKCLYFTKQETIV